MKTNTLALVSTCLLIAVTPLQARIKLVALPERQATVIRLDNPQGTLIQEERTLTLQKGVTPVDFSWKGVGVDSDSIRLEILSPQKSVSLLNVSYPPAENALIWELASPKATQAQVRISYLLNNIDRLVAYTGTANKAETELDLKGYLVLRNFSGEDFPEAQITLDSNDSFSSSLQHEETKQLLFFKKPKLPITKQWIFDSAKLPWDPEQVGNNVGIPVSYKIANDAQSGLGERMLWDGKFRLYQKDGKGNTLFLGEDRTKQTPVGEDIEPQLGESRDIVVTQRTMKNQRINIRRNKKNRVVLYDTNELIEAKLENFKDTPAELTLIQHIPGEWKMVQCSHDYERTRHDTLEFSITLPPNKSVDFSMHYNRLNVR